MFYSLCQARKASAAIDIPAVPQGCWVLHRRVQVIYKMGSIPVEARCRPDLST